MVPSCARNDNGEIRIRASLARVTGVPDIEEFRPVKVQVELAGFADWQGHVVADHPA